MTMAAFFAVPYGRAADAPASVKDAPVSAKDAPAPAKDAVAARKKPLLTMGRLLVATPKMTDPRYAGTIILLLDHSLLGSAGLIINRPTRMPLGAALTEVKGFRRRRDLLYYGGAYRRNRAMALVYSAGAPPKSLKLIKVCDKIYIGSGKKFFDNAMESLTPKDVIRVYSGYAKWDFHELKGQVAAGLWTVMEARPGIVFAKEPEILWHRLSRGRPQKAR